MRDIKVTQVGSTWQLVNPSKGEIFLQGMEGALSYFITSTLVTPTNSEPGLPLEVLAYRTASGHVWVKAANTGRILSGLFETPGERAFFEGAYATLQQSFLSTQQTTLPDLVTALANITEGDTTHPVAASAIYEVITAVSGKADVESPSLMGTPTAPTPEPGDNSTKLATTAYTDSAAGIAQTNAQNYADGLVIGLLDDRGNYNPTATLAYPTTGGSGVAGAILKGDLWSISADGNVNGIAVTVGDTIRALVDNPAQVNANWAITQNNLIYIPENSSNKATSLTLPNDTEYPTTQAVATALADYATVANQRYQFVSDASTTYTVPASAVTENGRTIIELSNNSLTSITISTATGTSKVAGDSVNISIAGTYAAQALVAGAGVTLQGDLTFSYQHQTKTLVYKGSNVWKVVG